jgi:TonB family protein
MNRKIFVALLVTAVVLMTGSCRREDKLRYLVISEAVHFELQPGAGTLNLPVFAGTMGVEKIVRDVSQAEFYYQKLAGVYGPKSFRFLADSTVELLLEQPGPLHAPQPVYSFDDRDSKIDLSLVSFENNAARYAFRVSDKKSGQVRDHTVDVPLGQSASIGLLADPAQKRGYLIAVAVQALAIGKDLTPARLADFLHEKNTPRGVKSSTGFRAGDQRWMDDIFGSRGTRLETGADTTQERKQVPFDKPPEPVGGMGALTAKFKYPESAKRDSLEGRVVVEVGIDENGNVSNCRVIRSVRADLDSAAVNTVRDVKFTPATYQGKSVATTVMIPIAFKLK